MKSVHKLKQKFLQNLKLRIPFGAYYNLTIIITQVHPLTFYDKANAFQTI